MTCCPYLYHGLLCDGGPQNEISPVNPHRTRPSTLYSLFTFCTCSLCESYNLPPQLSLEKTIGMPQAKLKPSDVAAEAKRTYIPYIEQRLPQFPAQSYVYPDSSKLRPNHGNSNGVKRKLRIAVIDGDPVDVALDWYDYNVRSNAKDCTAEGENAGGRIPVVNMANEKRAGGDWESGLVAPEECLCRRSNLVHALTTPSKSTTHSSHYPLQTTGGIYSPHVGASHFKLTVR